ncbi:hypothetical protein PISMIDRAFT_103548 [Pisolithus microcarpus 441]|uniref:Uncharacterized protein n=1 Tax=Pisolithus microcarpus 441 TaxID=765257 RepID=A0A0C9ZGV7_9AGAM|nr:hypothetical protein BKA83DRAFT_103548 [Pisolithus microcarpus]KIK21737.1 hypothetical protein PISMIDRAFT_103548 [Pisolithus microcarpus 441]
MAFIPSKHDRLVVDLWPTSHSEMIAACAGLHDLSSWEIFPCKLEDMCKWVTIAKDKSIVDKSRENIVIYQNPPDPTFNALYPVSIQLYGCLQNFTIGRFGNWDG